MGEMELIKPRVLKGFSDYLPSDEIARKSLIEAIEASFRSYAFLPIDTPALEYADILLGKGGGETEKQIYRFFDHGERDVALRFDLTVPFARFLAEHRAKLNFPFKRYHIAKVWRGENTQRGRYREFMQCDFDTVGSESAACDYEILHISHNILGLISGGEIEIKINHRAVFNSFLNRLGIKEKSGAILRTVDKLPKIGRDECLSLLKELTTDAENILDFVEIKGDFMQSLSLMKEAAGISPGIERLELLGKYIIDGGISSSITLDPSITRGLDYYTGLVFESFLRELPDIGSVCSGGRYDNLVGLYSKQKLPGVGGSIGLDRLIAALKVLERLNEKASYAQVGIACVDIKATGAYQALANVIRKAGINCEVFLEEEKITNQYQSAEKKGIKYFIIPNRENPNENFALRDLKERKNLENLDKFKLINLLSDLLRGNN